MSRNTIVLMLLGFVLLVLITSLGDAPPATDTPCEQVALPTGTTATLCPYLDHTGHTA